ncbi:transposase [Caloramator sp. CAR-1]|uniref:transposase n=1 Tax=Caloramator sp. CAR-1 TaxID=3062777 RepID=UPI0026E42CF6|nr:transposase [Caloramator sp. CAR-1]MDO6354565.1 transposase [Caloramator sp. CAR-1]
MPDLKTIKKSSIIDEYLDFIKEKYQDGVFASEIYKLIREKGYTGSERTVRYHVSKLKIEIDSEGQKKEREQKITLEKLIELLWKDVEHLKYSDKAKLETVLKNKSDLSRLYNLIQNFKIIIEKREVDKFINWLKEAEESEFKELSVFVKGIYNDYEATLNILKTDFSNALLEGDVNRLKTIKRQMFGRAGFELLRKKVLYQI